MAYKYIVFIILLSVLNITLIKMKIIALVLVGLLCVSAETQTRSPG